MKCLNCGSKDLFEVSIIDNQVLATEGYVSQTIVSYACEDCGHIEMYAPQSMIDSHKKNARRAKEREQRIANITCEIESVNAEIIRLESIIADENQTVKDIAIAKKELPVIKGKKTRLKYELDSLLMVNNNTILYRD